MKKFFELQNGHITESNPEKGTIIAYDLPSDIEKQELLKDLQIDQHTLESALDPEEISRVEFSAHHVFIIWKRPNSASFKEHLKFEVSSLGIFLNQRKITLILGEDNLPFSAKEFHGTLSLNSLVLKFLLHTIHHFMGHLKAIRQLNAELQTKLNQSTENQYLLQIFNLSESLIYYINALESNGSVLTKLRSCVDKLAFTKEEVEMLDDIIIEHQQCSKQVQIYSSILAGLMDARGNIINNNMNMLLKNLTLINVVFLPLNLIAGIGGMSEYTRITEHFIDWKVAYFLFLIGMIILGIVTWIILVKQFNSQKAVKLRKL